MRKAISEFGAAVIALIVLALAGAAQAASPNHTWVSHSGNDANPCTVSSPCATLAGAYGKTPAPGEIDIMDSGDFGSLNIDTTVAVVNKGAGTASVDCITVFASTSDNVILRGLTMNGSSGLMNACNEAIQIGFSNSVVIDHCDIQGFVNGPAIGFSAGSKLEVVDSVLANDGSSTSGAIHIQPAAFASANVAAEIERVRIVNALGNGIRVDSTENGSGGGLKVALHDVTVQGAAGGAGIVAVSPNGGGSFALIVADNVTATNNAGYGLRAVGAASSIVLHRSTIANNGVGIGVKSGGAIVSNSDNSFYGNVSGDGAATSLLSLK